MILETSFLIDLLRNDKSAVTKMMSLVDKNQVFGIASPSIFELWTGVIALDKPKNEKQKINSFIDDVIVYQLDKDSAKISGRINGELIKNGIKIDPEDCMIAGIAIKNNKKVLTRDEHFNRIEELKIEKY